MLFKKTFILFLLLVSAAGLCMVSCSDNSERYKKEIAELDSLVKELDKAEIQFKAIDSEKVALTYGGLDELMEQTTELIKDTLQKDEAILLSDFRSIKKPLREFKMRSSILKTEIVVTKDQLTHLSHDLKNGLLKEEDISKYVQSESDLAKTLIQSLNIISTIIPQQLAKYDSLKPLVLEFVKEKQELNSTKLPGT